MTFKIRKFRSGYARPSMENLADVSEPQFTSNEQKDS